MGFTADQMEGQNDFHFPAHTTPLKPPLISVESPHSVCSARSPRLASLLLALKDVLGDDTEDGLFVEPPAQHNSMNNISWSAGSTTFVDESNTGAEKYLDKNSPLSSPSPEVPLLDANDSLIIDRHSFAHDSHNDDADPDTRSPVLPHPDTELENNTLHYEPSAQFEQPSIHTISSSPVTEGDDSGAQSVDFTPSKVRDDLLSPVEISHLQLANFARASMDMTEPANDDIWRPPFPLALSPPRSPGPGSTFELLSSPFGSPSNRVLSPRLSAFIGRYSAIVADQNFERQGAHDSDLDSPQTHPVQETVRLANVSLQPAEVTVGESSDLSIACRGLADSVDESEVSAVIVDVVEEVVMEGERGTGPEGDFLEDREKKIEEDFEDERELGLPHEQDEQKEELSPKLFPDYRVEEKPQRVLSSLKVEEAQGVSKENNQLEIRDTFGGVTEEEPRDCFIGRGEETPQESSNDYGGKLLLRCSDEHRTEEPCNPLGESAGSTSQWLPEGENTPIYTDNWQLDLSKEHNQTEIRDASGEATEEEPQECLVDNGEEGPQESFNDYEESPRLHGSNNHDQGELLDESFGSAPQGEDTTIYDGTWQPFRGEVHSAIKRSSHPPTHFLQSRQIDFIGNEATANSSVALEVEEDTPGIPNPTFPEYSANGPVGPPSSPAGQSPDFPGEGELQERSDEVSEVLQETSVYENHDERTLTPVHTPDNYPPLVLEGESSESVRNDFDFNNSARLAYLEPDDEDRSGDGGSFSSLYAAYSDLSSPVQESALSIEAHEYRSTDATPGESSSVSTPLSSRHERIFTPPPPDGHTRMAMGEPPSPLPARHAISLSRRSSRLSSPYGIPPENGNEVASVDGVSSPVSTGESRKVPFGWRNSLVSVGLCSLYPLPLLMLRF